MLKDKFDPLSPEGKSLSWLLKKHFQNAEVLSMTPAFIDIYKSKTPVENSYAVIRFKEYNKSKTDKIELNSKKYLNSAKKFAQEYEDYFNEKIEISKNY